MHTVNLSSPVHNYGDIKEAWNSFKREQDPSSINVRDIEEVLSDLPDFEKKNSEAHHLTRLEAR